MEGSGDVNQMARGAVRPLRYYNGGPLLDDDAKQRIEERLKHDKHSWRDAMDRLKLKDLNAWWARCLTTLGDEERAKLPDRFTHSRVERLKRLYSRLCSYMSHDPDNDPGEAWPTQVQLADALGWSERNVRYYMRMLEVLGLVYTNRTKHRPQQCVTRNHYRLNAADNRPTGTQRACSKRHAGCRTGTLRGNCLQGTPVLGRSASARLRP